MTRAALVALVALTGCSENVGSPSPWVPWAEIEGALRPELAPSPQPFAGSDRAASLPLRVVTFNVERGENVEALARSFEDDEELRSAELVLLQEIESHPDEGGSRSARLAARLGMGYAYAPERLEGNGTHGLAILSVLPLSNVQVMQLPHVDLPWSEHQRIALSADVQLGQETIHVVTVHLDTRLNIQQRILQLRPAVIDAPPRTVIGGDFNTNTYIWADGSIPQLPVESVVGSEHQALELDDYMRRIGFATPTANSGSTQHTAVLDSRLDSIFVREMIVHPGQVEHEIDLSDHWPLWVDVLGK